MCRGSKRWGDLGQPTRLWTTFVDHLWTTHRAIPRAALRLVATDASRIQVDVTCLER
jgi:hypothetical protein